MHTLAMTKQKHLGEEKESNREKERVTWKHFLH